MSPAAEALRSVAGRLHAHFEVEPELEVRDGARARTGVVVRLWGVHPRGARALPGDGRSREIASRLAAIAGWALGQDAAALAEVVPIDRALYESRVVPGADEVAVGIRIAPRLPERTPDAAAREERCLRAVRSRLRELEIPER
jgi:hypothetical protein